MTTQAAIPLKWYVPFATGDSSRVEIPVTSSDATRASQTLGFPPLTMQPPAVGGVPPQGEDFNGAMNQVARVAWWVLNGGGWPYDATFATNSNIGGYPNGAVLQSADFLGQWISTADNNQSNPDTAGTNWVPGFQYGATALTGQTGGTVTLTPLQAAKRGLTITGTLTSALVIIYPTWVKDWSITNSTTGAFTVIAKTAAGSGVTIPQNNTPTPVAGDGTNITQNPQNIATGTSATHAAQVSQTTGRLLRRSVFTVSGTFTSLAATNSIRAILMGGGGAGGGCQATTSGQNAVGSGGASGAYTEFGATSGFSGGISITIGAAGLASTGANGGNGGTTSFGVLATAPGGGGGPQGLVPNTTNNFAQTATPASVGTVGAVTYSILAGGTATIGGMAMAGAVQSGCGAGGFAGAGGATGTVSGTGSNASGYGAGGAGSASGVSTAARSAGNGSAGIVIIEEFA